MGTVIIEAACHGVQFREPSWDPSSTVRMLADSILSVMSPMGIGLYDATFAYAQIESGSIRGHLVAILPDKPLNPHLHQQHAASEEGQSLLLFYRRLSDRADGTSAAQLVEVRIFSSGSTTSQQVAGPTTTPTAGAGPAGSPLSNKGGEGAEDELMQAAPSPAPAPAPVSPPAPAPAPLPATWPAHGALLGSSDSKKSDLLLSIPSSLTFQVHLERDDNPIGAQIQVAATGECGSLFSAAQDIHDIATVLAAHKEGELLLVSSSGETLMKDQKLKVYQVLGLSLPGSHPLPPVIALTAFIVARAANPRLNPPPVAEEKDESPTAGESVLRCEFLEDDGDIDVQAIHVSAGMDNIANVKRKIRKLKGIPVSQQTLTYGSRVLRDTDRVVEFIGGKNIVVTKLAAPNVMPHVSAKWRRFYAGQLNARTPQTPLGMSSFFVLLRIISSAVGLRVGSRLEKKGLGDDDEESLGDDDEEAPPAAPPAAPAAAVASAAAMDAESNSDDDDEDDNPMEIISGPTPSSADPAPAGNLAEGGGIQPSVPAAKPAESPLSLYGRLLQLTRCTPAVNLLYRLSSSESGNELSRPQLLVVIESLHALFRRIVPTAIVGSASGLQSHDCAVFESSAVCWAYVFGTALDDDASSVSEVLMPEDGIKVKVVVQPAGATDNAIEETLSSVPTISVLRAGPRVSLSADYAIMSARVCVGRGTGAGVGGGALRSPAPKRDITMATGAGAGGGAASSQWVPGGEALADTWAVHPLLTVPTEPHDGSSWGAVSQFLAHAAYARLRPVPAIRLKDQTLPSPSITRDWCRRGMYCFVDKESEQISGGRAARSVLYCPLDVNTTDADIDELIARAQDSSVIENVGGATAGFTRIPNEACMVLVDMSGSMTFPAFPAPALSHRPVATAGGSYSTPAAVRPAGDMSRIGAVKSFFHAFANRCAAYDFHSVVGLMTFNHLVKVNCELTESWFTFVRSLEDVDADGSTALWDAIFDACTQLIKFRELKPEHAGTKLRVLALTDGFDVSSKKPLRQLVEALHSNGIVLDVVAVGVATVQTGEANIEPVLPALTGLSGGGYFHPKSWEEALSLFENEPFLTTSERDQLAAVPPPSQLASFLLGLPTMSNEAAKSGLLAMARTVPRSQLHVGQFKRPPLAALSSRSLAPLTSLARLHSAYEDAAAATAAAKAEEAKRATSLAASRTRRGAAASSAASAVGAPSGSPLPAASPSPFGVPGATNLLHPQTATRIRRLMLELKRLVALPMGVMECFTCSNDINTWRVLMKAPSFPPNPYINTVYELSMVFPPEYPVRAPDIRFINPIKHCNISADGKVCHSILTQNYQPSFTVHDLLLNVQSMLAEPEPKDPIDSVLGELYLTNKVEYERRAREAAQPFTKILFYERKRAIQDQEGGLGSQGSAAGAGSAAATAGSASTSATQASALARLPKKPRMSNKRKAGDEEGLAAEDKERNAEASLIQQAVDSELYKSHSAGGGAGGASGATLPSSSSASASSSSIQIRVSGFPPELTCPLTRDLFVNPARNHSGRVYELSALEEHARIYGLVDPIDSSPGLDLLKCAESTALPDIKMLQRKAEAFRTALAQAAGNRGRAS